MILLFLRLMWFLVMFNVVMVKLAVVLVATLFRFILVMAKGR